MTERREVAVAGHRGDASRARAALGHADPVVRQLALGALQRGAAVTVADLQALLGDTDPGVRRRVVAIAATVAADDEVGGLLAVALHDRDASVVETAAWACGEREQVPPDVFERLVELATTAADPLVREAAVAALGAIGDERGLPAILHGCADKPAIRRRAVLALAPFDSAEAIAALRRALTDRDWQVRQSAEDVIRAAGLTET